MSGIGVHLLTCPRCETSYALVTTAETVSTADTCPTCMERDGEAQRLGLAQACVAYPSELGQAEHDRASAARACGYGARWPSTSTRVPRHVRIMPYRGGPLRSQLTALRDAPNRSPRDYRREG